MFEIIETDRPPGLELKKRSVRQPTEGQAWDASIEKWKLIHRVCSQRRLIADGGIKTCGLCALYFFGHEDECEDCPIKKAGHLGCAGTPYRDYLAAVEKGSLELAKQAAANEIDFLRSFHMGLDYSYKLYFKREHLWDALQGVVGIAWAHQPPCRIVFPDHELSIPLISGDFKEKDFQHDDPEFDFAIVLNFEPDEFILEYLRERGYEDDHRSPPDPDTENLLGIGMIYLTVYQEIPDQPASDLVLFNFGTTGTNMSILFEESTAIRRTFVVLLQKIPGVCGVFNKEMSGELIWLKGQHLSEKIDDPFMMPDEIEAILGKLG